ncbi:hypothetical protein BALCAV_0221880 [Alkalihalobacillus alcalophilus ATCC 27647 = CGMCC 1.3604]|uniref:Uncharacterized protein n=1 Tax=Alkalihalobacillus alcalophilus ATCC 27647 = CGMCC 1.3604 TaxID=1218173 RepID=A0A094WCP6_ALKAL|nr:hypothetical protein BALCAV_0221880 [Alkalihalobacillus alcalophilus ATCC 27647 = CGMCC 1.3604]
MRCPLDTLYYLDAFYQHFPRNVLLDINMFTNKKNQTLLIVNEELGFDFPQSCQLWKINFYHFPTEDSLFNRVKGKAQR